MSPSNTPAPPAPRRRRQARRLAPIALAFALALLAAPAAAQTDYYNTDAGRPIWTEDASPLEHRALELQLAPLRLERARGGAYAWGIEPEVAVGILPRTQLEVGFPLVHADLGDGARSSGLAGIELAALHALNVETSLPALAVAGELLLPAGRLAPDATYASLKGIATKTYPWARVHANARYTFGDDPETTAEGAHGAAELSRWAAGLAVDRTLPLESLLLTAELVARRPLAADADVQWDTAAGARYQLAPRLALDGGAGYRLTGDAGWFVTFGAAVSLGLPWSRGR